MVTFSRAYRAASNNAANRSSVASNITIHSTKTGSHNSFISSAAKRVASAFDHRASWATTTSKTFGSSDEKDSMSPTYTSTNVTSETASVNSVEKGKKLKGSRVNFVQTLVARFENNKSGSEHTESRDHTESPRDSVSPVVVEKSKRNELKEAIPFRLEAQTKYQSRVESIDSLKDVGSLESTNDVVAPLAKKESPFYPILRTVASHINMRKRDSVKRPKKRLESEHSSGPGDVHALDPKLASSWTSKVDALAAWAESNLTSGRMTSLVIPSMQQANDVSVRLSEDADTSGSESVILGSSQLLTPEEDLVACFRPNSCHPHRTAYFAKSIKEVLSVNKDEISSDRQAYAKEVSLTLVHHPCRVPLIFRIQAAHFLVRSDWPGSKEGLLRLAWKWCHELQTTALVLSLMNSTHRHWTANIDSLVTLPSHEIEPPIGGYAVKYSGSC